MHKPSKRQAVVAGVCAVLVGGGTAAALVVSGSDSEPDEPAAVAPSATPDETNDRPTDRSKDSDDRSQGADLSAGAVRAAAEKASVEPKVVTDAVTTIDTTLDSLFAPLEAGKEPKIPGVVGKALREEIEIAQYERQDAGWKITGSPTLDELEVVKVDNPAKPTAMTIKVCVDTGDVTIKNSTGRDMTTKTATRSRSVFDMDLVKSEWRATSRSLAGNADCSA